MITILENISSKLIKMKVNQVIVKFFVLTFLTFLTFFAQAKCNIQVTATPEILDPMLSKGFYFKNFNQVCTKLNKANARVNAVGAFYTINGKNVTVLSVQAMDMNTTLIADGYVSNVVAIENIADDKNKNKMLAEALNDAIAQWSIDLAIKSLQLQREKIKLKQ